MDKQKPFQSVAVRKWKGNWASGTGIPAPDFSAPPGGFVLTFHDTVSGPPYKVEHYSTVEKIKETYPGYFWMQPDPRDPNDIVLVGI